MHKNDNSDSDLLKVIQQLIKIIVVLLIGIILVTILFFNADHINNFFKSMSEPPKKVVADSAISSKNDDVKYWIPPDFSAIVDVKMQKQLEYGKELIVHTAKYLGPKGSVKKISNGLNCQNCHLEAGTKIFGNNYGSVASMYPKFRARSGKEEDIYKRVNDCFERSLNGKPLDISSNEMQAIKTYIEFLGSNVEKGKKAEGSGFKELAFLDRAADPEKGLLAYGSKCQSCHQSNGEGLMNTDGTEYSYPALWGDKSYNDGAGLFRISNFAKYIKYNMPLGVSHNNAQLTDEEAWDIAAYVNSQPRPHISVPKDWPDKSKKPIDHPFGPYADQFSEKQHKYGPFKPIESEAKSKNTTK